MKALVGQKLGVADFRSVATDGLEQLVNGLAVHPSGPINRSVEWPQGAVNLGGTDFNIVSIPYWSASIKTVLAPEAGQTSTLNILLMNNGTVGLDRFIQDICRMYPDATVAEQERRRAGKYTRIKATLSPEFTARRVRLNRAGVDRVEESLSVVRWPSYQRCHIHAEYKTRADVRRRDLIEQTDGFQELILHLMDCPAGPRDGEWPSKQNLGGPDGRNTNKNYRIRIVTTLAPAGNQQATIAITLDRSFVDVENFTQGLHVNEMVPDAQLLSDPSAGGYSLKGTLPSWFTDARVDKNNDHGTSPATPIETIEVEFAFARGPPSLKVSYSALLEEAGSSACAFVDQ